MATPLTNPTPHGLTTEGSASSQDAEWRILAEEAAQELNPQKLIEVVEALTRAIDREQKQNQSSA